MLMLLYHTIQKHMGTYEYVHVTCLHSWLPTTHTLSVYVLELLHDTLVTLLLGVHVQDRTLHRWLNPSLLLPSLNRAFSSYSSPSTSRRTTHAALYFLVSSVPSCPLIFSLFSTVSSPPHLSSFLSYPLLSYPLTSSSLLSPLVSPVISSRLLYPLELNIPTNLKYPLILSRAVLPRSCPLVSTLLCCALMICVAPCVVLCCALCCEEFQGLGSSAWVCLWVLLLYVLSVPLNLPRTHALFVIT